MMCTQKILIVDDRPANLHALTLVLRDTGADLIEAANGQEALAATLEHTFALAILDVQMPGMDGYELAELLRGNPETRAIPIIFLTAASPEDHQVFKGYESGAVDYVVKPYSAEIMLAKARIFLELHAQKCELEQGQRLLEERVQARTADLEKEIATRRQAQSRAEHLNSLLRTIRRINQMIQQEDDPLFLIKRACELLQETRGYRGTWIALGECNTPAVYTAQAGWDTVFTSLGEQLAKGIWPACCTASIESHELLQHPINHSDCQSCPLHIEEAGYSHAISALRHADRQFGVLAIALPTEAWSDEEELRLLTSISDDLAFALHDLELRQEKQESEAEVRLLYDQAPILLLLLDERGRICKANRKAMEWAERSEAKNLRQGELLQCLHVKDSPKGCGFGALCQSCQIRKAVEHCLVEGDEVQQLPVQVQQKFSDGTQRERQLLLAAAPLRLGDRQFVQLNLQDVSVLREAEEARLAESRRAQQYLDIAGVILLVLDFSGKVRMINQKGSEVLGLSAAEITGKSWIESFVSPEDRDRVRENQRALLSGSRRGRFNCECSVLNNDGQPRLIAWDQTVIQNEAGEIVGTLNSGEDVSERRKHEMERAELQEQLQQAQKMESIGRLAGGVAHDFNNMLSIILGYCENILDQLREDDPLCAEISQIREAGQRSAALTRQLLAFSRKQTLQPRVLDLNSLIQNLERMLGRLIGEDVHLQLQLADSLDTVLADTGQMEQVLMNLAVNARDAMPMGGRLLIETSNVELDEEYAQQHLTSNPGAYVMLAVSDSGCGMSAETRKRIFDPFFTTKEQGKGTGLGLATVYGIVKQSGGNIWVYSEEGKGSSFKIYLPRCTEMPDVQEKQERTVRKAQGEHVLLVEDEPALRHLAESVLGRLGFRVTTAANGEEALFSFMQAQPKPQLLISDVIMPGMSGKELVEQLRKIDPDLRVLYMSGYTDNAVVQHGILDSGTPFIQKPFSIRDLAAKAREAMQG